MILKALPKLADDELDSILALRAKLPTQELACAIPAEVWEDVVATKDDQKSIEDELCS